MPGIAWDMPRCYGQILLAVLLCTVAIRSDNESIVEAPYQPDYAKGLPERQLWKQLRDSFLKHKYRPLLKKHGFELTCNGCSAVFLDVAFSVGLAGEVRIHRVDAAKACGREFPEGMRKDFLHFLKIYPYPAGLHGTSVRLRLGSGLSC
ncbi:MAG: hypothetical protein U1F27_09295 [Turneriella sp.]